MNHKVICVVGTQPEAIKMAPIILALKREPTLDVRVLATAQHRHLLDKVMKVSRDTKYRGKFTSHPTSNS